LQEVKAEVLLEAGVVSLVVDRELALLVEVQKVDIRAVLEVDLERVTEDLLEVAHSSVLVAVVMVVVAMEEVFQKVAEKLTNRRTLIGL
jgi:hypothetical protein